jgi:hypothetical protein
MRKVCAVLLMWAFSLTAIAQDEPSLTIYNGGFAAVRERLPLDLKPGVNTVTFPGATAQVEPQSVVLRDPENQHQFQILEQSYRNDPVTQLMLLSLYEGKVIDFLVHRNGREEYVKGKVIRSGYVPQQPGYPIPYYYTSVQNQPLIEVDGKLRFTLPGEPVFPDLADDTILKPTLNWQLQSASTAAFKAELGYLTQGMTWNADYNLVAPEEGDNVDMIGWVTMRNYTGKVFENARIRLMAGDVNKLQPREERAYLARAAKEVMADAMSAPVVTQKSFDEFHLYTLARPATLHDQETKQVEFVRATNVPSKRLYVYDGLQNTGWYGPVGEDPNYGIQSNKKVWVMQELKNSKTNNLGLPLPKGRLRFYRRDTDGSLQFVGENEIDHTAENETIRVYTGNAFDVVGERKRTDFQVNRNQEWADESFEIRVRNHKKKAVEIRVVEHLYRWTNWKISASSDKHQKMDAQTMEFRVTVPPDGERVVTYTVHYTW